MLTCWDLSTWVLLAPLGAGAAGQGQGLQGGPFVALSVGAGPLTLAPKLQQMEKIHPPLIQLFHRQELPAWESSPSLHPPFPSPPPTRSGALKTGHRSSLCPAQGLSVLVSACWSLHTATGNLSLQPQAPFPTRPVLLSPPGPGPPP